MGSIKVFGLGMFVYLIYGMFKVNCMEVEFGIFWDCGCVVEVCFVFICGGDWFYF